MLPQDEVGSWKAIAIAAETAAGITAPTGVEESQLGYMLRASAAIAQLNGGSSGVELDVRGFGAVGDDVTDDGPAFLAALAAAREAAILLPFAYGRGAPKIRIPAGRYFLGTTTLDLFDASVVLEGDGVGFGSGGSILRWTSGTTGIRTQTGATVGASGSRTQNFVTGTSAIRGLCLDGGYVSGVESEAHGIHLRAAAVIENCMIRRFPGDGIYSSASSVVGENANLVFVSKSSIEFCRNGIRMDDIDANACGFVHCNASGNRQWGVWDSSFLGNTYVGCHAAANGWDGAISSIPTGTFFNGHRYYVKRGQEAWVSTNAPTGDTTDNQGWGYVDDGGVYNGVPAWVSGITFRTGGSYRTDSVNARNVFTSCYAEGDQGFAQMIYPTLVFGGLYGATGKSIAGLDGGYGCPGVLLGASEGGISANLLKLAAGGLWVGEDKVIGAREPGILNPTGGATVDTECRAILIELLDALRAGTGHGLIGPLVL